MPWLLTDARGSESLLLRRPAFNAVARFRDRFTAAARAAARAGNATAVAEDETTVLAFGGFESELQQTIPGHRFDDVAEMVLDLSFGYPDNFCESSRRQRSNHEQIHNALSRGALGWKHTVILIVYSCCQRTAGSSFPTFAFHAHVSLSLLPTEQKFLDHFG